MSSFVSPQLFVHGIFACSSANLEVKGYHEEGAESIERFKINNTSITQTEVLYSSSICTIYIYIIHSKRKLVEIRNII